MVNLGIDSGIGGLDFYQPYAFFVISVQACLCIHVFHVFQ
jgi:hypothetical protein